MKVSFKSTIVREYSILIGTVLLLDQSIFFLDQFMDQSINSFGGTDLCW